MVGQLARRTSTSSHPLSGLSAWLLEIREMLGLLVKAYRNFGSTTDPAAGSFKEQRSKIVILLAGGNKQTQSRDIKMVLRLARNL